jgi:hypothetical protein
MGELLINRLGAMESAPAAKQKPTAEFQLEGRLRAGKSSAILR